MAPKIEQLPAWLVAHLGGIDPAWAAVIERANHGGPGSSPQKPLYIAWTSGPLKPKLLTKAQLAAIAAAGAAGVYVGTEIADGDS